MELNSNFEKRLAEKEKRVDNTPTAKICLGTPNVRLM